MSLDQPYFRLATYGDTGSTQVQLITFIIFIIMLFNMHVQFDYPKDSDLMEVFECQEV